MMHQYKMTKVILAIGLALTLGVAFTVLAGMAQGPVDQTFTYQGQLLRGGNYYSGSCNFKFSLFNAAAGGSQVGSVQTVNQVTVKDGYFTVNLNSGSEFGTTAFTGSKRYLTIQVRCPEDSAFVALNSQRVELKAAPLALYALNSNVITIPWTSISEKPAGFADNVDDVTTYTPGYGLELIGSQFSVITDDIIAAMPPNTYNQRVTGTCAGNNAIRVVKADGSVTCQSSGGATLVAGQGVDLTGAVLAIDDVYIQRRVATDCGPGQAIRAINQDGSPQCEAIPAGDITGVIAGAGLTGGGSSGDVSLSIPAKAVTTAMLADKAVTNAKLQNGIVDTAKLADGAVNAAKIQDHSLTFADFAGPCADGQTISWQAVNNSWGCVNDIIATYTGGDGLDLTDNVVSVKIGEGTQIDAGDQLVLNFETPANGTSTQAARSDHTHGDTYLGYTTAPASGDLTGNYSSGFQVTGLQSHPVQMTLPSYGDVLRYNGSAWRPADYLFPLIVDIDFVSSNNGSDGDVSVSCPSSNPKVLGGGCRCNDNNNIHVNEPSSSGWNCSCDNGSDDENTAFAFCVKADYGD